MIIKCIIRIHHTQKLKMKCNESKLIIRVLILDQPISSCHEMDHQNSTHKKYKWNVINQNSNHNIKMDH